MCVCGVDCVGSSLCCDTLENGGLTFVWVCVCVCCECCQMPSKVLWNNVCVCVCVHACVCMCVCAHMCVSE